MDEDEPTWVAATSMLQGNQAVLGSWVQSVSKVRSIPQPGGQHAQALHRVHAWKPLLRSPAKGTAVVKAGLRPGLFSRLLPSSAVPSKFC